MKKNKRFVLAFGLFVFALVMLNKPKVYEYQYYTGVVDKMVWRKNKQ